MHLTPIEQCFTQVLLFTARQAALLIVSSSCSSVSEVRNASQRNSTFLKLTGREYYVFAPKVPRTQCKYSWGDHRYWHWIRVCLRPSRGL